MNRNSLYLIIAALAVLTVLLGYQFYMERNRTHGIAIKVDRGGITVEKK